MMLSIYELWTAVKDIITLGPLWRDFIMIPSIEIALQSGLRTAVLLKAPPEYTTVG